MLYQRMYLPHILLCYTTKLKNLFFMNYDNRVNNNTHPAMGKSENEAYFQCFPLTHISKKVKTRKYSK